jgi:cation diffusion facilitator CzcD-associated flavoprotein CzcO
MADEQRPLDVLIIGAGISGLGAGCHLSTRAPGRTFAILEGRDSIGGTWDLFRFPGIRSDSDLHTFGFAFKPWTRKEAIASADSILDYLREAVAEHGLERHIRFGHQVESAAFDTTTGLWTVTARTRDGDTVQLTARFLFTGTGYYDYRAGYTPDFDGVEEFEGRMVHPQLWPEDLDHTGKKVVVIGSGATAVTLVPAMAGTAAHVTMLQRSPSYVLSQPAEDVIANTLNKVLGPHRAYPITRRKNILRQRAIYVLCKRFPKFMRRVLVGGVKRQLPKGYDVERHFQPHYDPWDQRLCLVPDGDLFASISSGDASVVTDHIDRFTPTGIRLRSGAELEADIVISATGLNLLPLGGIELTVDGRPVDVAETTIFRSMMLSGVPNFAFAMGYTNSSWTLKVDLVCQHLCRLLDHLDAGGHRQVVPVLDGPEQERRLLMDLTSGYVQRGMARFPKGGTRGPWTAAMAYEKDVARLVHGPVVDRELRFGSGSTAASPASPTAVPA